jgi:hypothetical protein
MSWRLEQGDAVIRLACVLFVVTTVRASDQPTGASSVDLDPTWLAPTRDPQTGLLSRGVRPEEAPGYFAILNHARQVPLPQLKAAAAKFQNERRAVLKNDPQLRYYFRKPGSAFPTFVDLHQHAETYHGRLVTLRGHARRVLSYPAGENAFGIQQLHEAWLYVEDAQQNPVIVVCTELPPGLPTGSDILIDQVSATGYFFKRFGYEDRAGNSRFAPLILAQRLEWSPKARGRPIVSPGMWFGLIVAVAIGVAGIWWISQRSSRRQANSWDSLENPCSSAGGP